MHVMLICGGRGGGSSNLHFLSVHMYSRCLLRFEQHRDVASRASTKRKQMLVCELLSSRHIVLYCSFQLAISSPRGESESACALLTKSAEPAHHVVAQGSEFRPQLTSTLSPGANTEFIYTFPMWAPLSRLYRSKYWFHIFTSSWAPLNLVPVYPQTSR